MCPISVLLEAAIRIDPLCFWNDFFFKCLQIRFKGGKIIGSSKLLKKLDLYQFGLDKQFHEHVQSLSVHDKLLQN